MVIWWQTLLRDKRAPVWIEWITPESLWVERKEIICIWDKYKRADASTAMSAIKYDQHLAPHYLHDKKIINLGESGYGWSYRREARGIDDGAFSLHKLCNLLLQLQMDICDGKYTISVLTIHGWLKRSERRMSESEGETHSAVETTWTTWTTSIGLESLDGSLLDFRMLRHAQEICGRHVDHFATIFQLSNGRRRTVAKGESKEDCY